MSNTDDILQQAELRAEERLPSLQSSSQSLLLLVDEMYEGLQYSDDDHLGFMAINFLSKQSDHLKSLLTLFPSRDMILISRSMIEGLCQLLWAAQEPDIRSIKWRAFSCIQDWRNMKTFLDRGETVESANQEAVAENLQKNGEMFLINKAKNAKSRGTSLPEDPYHKDWKCGKSIREICEMTGGLDLYEKLYAPWSDWHHWAAAGFSESLSWQENRVTYLSWTQIDAARALACGFMCLIQTADLTNRHLDIGFSSRISELKQQYIKEQKSLGLAV